MARCHCETGEGHSCSGGPCDRCALLRTRKALRIAKRALQFLANDGQGWAPGAKEALADIRRAERGK